MFSDRYRAFFKSTVTSSTDHSTHEHQTAMVFAELIAYIESYETSKDPKVFNMSVLCKLYSNRLTKLGISIDKKVHSTNLKDKILSAILSLASYKIGQNVVLSLKQITGKALLDVSRNNNLS